ncbi:multi-sensor hybrid histidine kinase [Nostoc commune NIES-4072]|uniref:Multi-sensor hybrid histidine kinase n=1 Tax=Nostoc commune NIES-4072 TaxID=2005467 RepID=A0A2R5FG77_NOSCO|nr:hypothetical protein [Nostoc commune]BBD65095.1 multi-sensor hybrid histidine kinase [Nostoc commune HK-02]GBG17580.1 multi-sensor hybrid histidine kinase [Nostoc commune NIES-4072]
MGNGAWADGGAGEAGEDKGVRAMRENNYNQCPMPNAQCPMPNAQCPMPNAQCPIPNFRYLKNRTL